MGVDVPEQLVGDAAKKVEPEYVHAVQRSEPIRIALQCVDPFDSTAATRLRIGSSGDGGIKATGTLRSYRTMRSRLPLRGNSTIG